MTLRAPSIRLLPGIVVLVAAAAATAAFAFTPASALPPPAGRDTKEAVVKDPPIDLSRLPDRSVWSQVNSKPFYVTSVVNVLCAAPTPARVEDERKRNPHASTAITVFVNETGRAAMFSPSPMTFPAGSVIVKQKFDPRDEPETPLLYTVMIKRERGFNPDAGDWEFAVVSGNGRDVEARGAIATCIACHAPQGASDYVFRSYLER